MPTRRINFTNRLAIQHSDARFTLRENGEELEFDANIMLSNLELPYDARVFVEAYHRTRYMRFDYGLVGEYCPPSDRVLQGFDFPERIKFRVKVVKPYGPHGILLAEADGVRPRRSENEEEGEFHLLDYQRSRDLGNEVWRLDFSDGTPVVLVNANLINVLELESDPTFTALITPVALRMILTTILLGEPDWEEDDMNDWRSRWILFARRNLGMREPPLTKELEECDDWINDTARRLCEKVNAVELFSQYWMGAHSQ